MNPLSRGRKIDFKVVAIVIALSCVQMFAHWPELFESVTLMTTPGLRPFLERKDYKKAFEQLSTERLAKGDKDYLCAIIRLLSQGSRTDKTDTTAIAIAHLESAVQLGNPYAIQFKAFAVKKSYFGYRNSETDREAVRNAFIKAIEADTYKTDLVPWRVIVDW